MTAAIVVGRVGKVELRDFQDLENKIRVFEMKPLISSVSVSVKSPTMNVLNLRLHKVWGEGIPDPYVFAYWPENWLDEWGIKEIYKFLKIEPKEEGHDGTDYIVVDGRNVVATDLDIRETVRMDLQRTQTSPAQDDAISQGRHSLDSGGHGRTNGDATS